MLKLLGKHVFLIGIFLILTIHTASAQLLGLALSLGNTLAGYIFDIYLRTENTLDIDGAPNWYYPNPLEPTEIGATNLKPAATPLTHHTTLLLQSESMDRSGGIGFRCAADT